MIDKKKETQKDEGSSCCKTSRGKMMEKMSKRSKKGCGCDNTGKMSKKMEN